VTSGTEFRNNLFRRQMKIFGMDKTRTTPFRPQSDGMVECMNCVVLSILRQYVDTMQSD
jgi:hypothetical protein